MKESIKKLDPSVLTTTYTHTLKINEVIDRLNQLEQALYGAASRTTDSEDR
jgi:hypothetical protein